ncbi:MAG: YdbH domain-containing protein, partial [Deltaproteobacteria bacterium]|nr:YdbH domain-containing protein [Deltaproteobacteria bacterium]
MSSKRKIIFSGGLLFILAVLLFGLLAGFYFYLPHYLESKIIPQIATTIGISELSVNVRNTGFWGADLGNMRIGEQQKPALLIRSVQIDYTPKGLYQRKIEGVTLSGVELFGEFTNGKISLRGFELKKVLTRLPSRKTPVPASESSAPQFFLRQFKIRNCVINLNMDDRHYSVPVEIDIIPEDTHYDRLNVTAFLYPRAHKISAELKIDLSRQKIGIDVETEKLNLSRFADLFQPLPAMMVSGMADLAATAELHLQPFKISAAKAEFKLYNSNIRYKNFQLQHVGDNHNPKIPFYVKIERVDSTKWQVSASDISAASPIPMRLDKITATIEQAGEAFKGSGNLKVSVEPPPDSGLGAPKVRMITPYYFAAGFKAAYSNSGTWRLDLTSTPRAKPLSNVTRIHLDPFELTSKTPAVDLAVTGNRNKIEATYAINVARVRASSKDVNLLLPKIVLRGRAEFGKNDSITQAVVFDLTSPVARMNLNTTEINMEGIAVHGRIKRDKLGKFNLDSKARFAKAGLKSPQMQFQIVDTRIRLPFQWPVKNPTNKGALSVAEVHYGNLKLGSVTATVNQTASGLAFAGNFKDQLIPALTAEFSGHSNLFRTNNYETHVHFKIAYPEDAPEIKLERFSPAAKGFTFKGKLLETGDLIFGNGGFNGSTQTKVENGQVLNRQNKISVEGIQTDLFIGQLANLRSAPGQQIKFAKASFGGLNIENGKVDFQIESNRSVLIEKGRFSWCDGKVEAPAIRLTSGAEDYNLILYCDRLNLAKVLEQFSAAQVEAEGELNGKIDLRYQNGILSFDDGFLYSTPGEPGKIRMVDTEILTAGVPKDTPQYAQMELARKALEDYDYS